MIMVQHWTEVVPGDRYIVTMDGFFHDLDRKVLSYLYQPLIGPVCLSLYITLSSQVEENRLWSEPSLHYHLMSLLGLSLQEIYDARLKLEAIGLLKTYVKQEDDSKQYVYYLQPPLSPKQFFSDSMLNIFLYKKIGNQLYRRLKQFFADRPFQVEEYENVTREFQQVFTSSSMMTESQDKDLFNHIGSRFIEKPEAETITVFPETFNFDLFLAGLSDHIIPKSAITPTVKDAILKLAFLYGIDHIQMKNIVFTVINEKDEIDIEQLRKTARDWYQLERSEELPMLIDRTQPRTLLSENVSNDPKEVRLIQYLETVSPRQVLKDISNGAEPSKADLQLIEEIMFQQKLPPGVTNVLIQYVLLKTDMKLHKSYVQKIASHWARKKIKTVQEAMNLAKKEHRQYMEWANQKNKPSSKVAKPIRSEKVPEWFKEDEFRQTAKSNESTDETFDFEEEKRKMEERLKKYKK